jgi:hypothetical protein
LVYEYYWIDYKEAAKKGEIAYYDAPRAYNFSEKPQDASNRLDDRDGALLYQKIGDENNPTQYNQPNNRQPIDKINSDGTFTSIVSTTIPLLFEYSLSVSSSILNSVSYLRITGSNTRYGAITSNNSVFTNSYTILLGPGETVGVYYRNNYQTTVDINSVSRLHF